MCVGEKNIVYIEFGTITKLQASTGGLETSPVDKGRTTEQTFFFNFPNHWINIMQSSKIRVDYLDSPNG